jgi:hypothetical protein
MVQIWTGCHRCVYGHSSCLSILAGHAAPIRGDRLFPE